MEIKLIEQIVKKVFPKEATLVWNAKEVSLEDRFWIIGSAKGSRWLIPQGSIYGLPILSQWRPYGALSQVKWQFLLAAYRTQQLHRLPGITPIGVLRSRTGNWNHLGGPQNQAFIPVIYIGTPGLTRKAVVSLTDVQRQVVVSVAKIPLEETATVNILREAEILASLTLVKPGVAPKPLFVNQDLGIAVQSAIPGKLVGKHLTKAHIQWLDRLYIPDRTTSLQAQANKLHHRINKLPNIDRSTIALLGQVLSTIDDPTTLPSTWVHGDFAPWNLKWVNNQSLMAIDWEDTHADGLPLYDLFHYHYIQSYLLYKRENILNVIWKQPLITEYLHILGIDRSIYEKLALFYLTDVWARSIENQKWNDASFFMTEILHILG